MKLPPRAEQSVVTRKYRDTYARVPGCGFVQKDFGLWMCLAGWKEDALPDDVDIDAFFIMNKVVGIIWEVWAGARRHFVPIFRL